MSNSEITVSSLKQELARSPDFRAVQSKKQRNQLLKQAFGGLQTDALTDPVEDHKESQRLQAAKKVTDQLAGLGDIPDPSTWQSMVKQIPLSLGMSTNVQHPGFKQLHIYDFSGLTPKEYQDEATEDNELAIGSNRQNKDYRNAAKWYLYHQRKLVAYQTNPNGHPKGIEDQETALEHYNHLMNANDSARVDSWLKKLNDANFWAKYHENKIDMWVYDRPKYQRRINAQVKLRDKWLKKANEYRQQKDTYLGYVKRAKQAALDAQQAARRKKVDAAINQQVSANQTAKMTSIYCADHSDPTVIAVSELSPSETTSMNLPTKSIDHDMPEGDYANVSSIQLSGTYYAYLDDDVPMDDGYNEKDSPAYANMLKKFRTLENWAKGNKRIVVCGFAFWSSTSIASVGRSSDTNSAANALPLAITFQYQRVATIKMAKQRKAAATKRRGRARKSGHKGKSRTIKRGDTLLGIAHGNYKTYHKILHMNPSYKSHPNMIIPGRKLRLPS